MYWAELTERERRATLAIGAVAVVILVGLTITGTWQFLHHEPNPEWFRYRPGSNDRFSPGTSTGMAAAHGAFADAGAVLSLLASAWLAAKVLFRVPRLGLIAFLLAVFGLFTGSAIRFNAVLKNGVYQEEAGYLQVFSREVDFVLTDRFEIGPVTFSVLTMLHVLTVPVLLLAAAVIFRRVRALQAESNSTGASWLERLASSDDPWAGGDDA